MMLWELLLLPLALGLLGFVEPCSVGSILLFVKYLEGRDAAAKLRATVAFTVTRALFLGAMGAVAALLGTAFFDLQSSFWILLGTLYVGLGVVYLAGRQGWLMRVIGPTLSRASDTRGAAGLGLLFGLNVPACAAPLLGAVLAATLGAAGVVRGFAALAVFGLALSLPLVAAVYWRRPRRWLDRIAALSVKAPLATGAVFVVLGGLSIYFGLSGG